MKVVVTGGAGFIGSHIVDRLIREHHEVVVIDDLSTGLLENVNPQAELLNLDIARRGNWSALEGCDVVFHEAALPRIEYSLKRPYQTFRANVAVTAKILEMARTAKVKRVVYASSSSVYGTQLEPPVSESSRCNPSSPYASQKYMGELMCRYYSQHLGLDTVCLRYFNVYGERQSATGAYKLVLKIFLDSKAQGRPLTIYGDGKQTRDFTHVSDVVEANMLAMKCSGKLAGAAINIGTGVETSVNRIAELIGGKTEHIHPNPRAAFEERRKSADINTAIQLLGWRPKVKIEEGIAMLLRNKK